MKYRRDWDLSKFGGMKPKDKAFIRDSINVGETLNVKIRKTKKGILYDTVKVVQKFKHHFLALNNSGYKVCYMYIDLYCLPEEGE